MKKGNNPVLEKSFSLALQSIEFAEELENTKKYVIAKQILRAGTSIGANIRESQSSESTLDFIHKLKIADKESCELEYWFELCKQSPYYQNPSQEIEDTLLTVKKLLSKIIAKTKLNLQTNKN